MSPRIDRLLHRLKRRLQIYGNDYDHRVAFWTDWLHAGYWDDKATSAHQDRKAAMIARAVDKYTAAGDSLHELGCGMGRNLEAIRVFRPDLKLSANDLDWERCRSNMATALQETLNFVEQDTLSFLEKSAQEGRKYNVLLTSDHLIHITPDVIDRVLDLMPRVSSKYIIFHEAVRSRKDRNLDYWYLHDYGQLKARCELLYSESSWAPPLNEEYELRVYKVR